MMTRASFYSAKGDGIYIQRGPLEDIASSVDRTKSFFISASNAAITASVRPLCHFPADGSAFRSQDKRGYYIKGITKA